MGCFYMNALILLVSGVCIYGLFKWISHMMKKPRKLNQWNIESRDKVILHGFHRGKTLPNLSPYVLKVEAFLRLANIPYKFDDTDTFGPKGKAPWISYQGNHIGDSELIIEFLTKKFELNLNNGVNDEQLAIASLARTVLEEYVVWGMALHRTGPGLEMCLKISQIPRLLVYFLRYVMRDRAKKQGLGIHSKHEIEAFVSRSLADVSKVIGNKRFVCGERLCIEDCGIFGILAQAVWGLPGSPYEKLVKNDLKNIERYCEAVREKIWPGDEWEKCLWKQ